MFEVVEKLGMRQYGSGKKPRSVVLVRCTTCGGVSEILHQNAMKSNRNGNQHCAHCIKETYHFMTNTRIWRIWQGLRWRVKDRDDKNYGGRGIAVCPEWSSFVQFYEDMWVGYSDDLTIERIDVNGPYSKDNCRWASNMEQQSNKRNNRCVSYQGEQLHLAELVRRSGFSKMMLRMRLNRGMTADEAVQDCMGSGYGKSQRPADIKRREKRMSMT